MAFTVTATATGSTIANDVDLRIFIFTSAASSPVGGSSSNFPVSSGTYDTSVTVAATGSYVVGAMLGPKNITYTSLANSTVTRDLNDTSATNVSCATFISSAKTSATGAANYGSSAAWSTDGGTVAAEIKANGTLVNDTTDAPATATTTTATHVTTASFTPPAGSLVVACVAGLSSSGYTITDTSGLGLTWTTAVQNDTDGTAGIYWATIPAGTTVTIAGAQAAVATGAASGTTTKPVSGSRPAVASRSASGASTKPASASRPAIASGTAAGASTKPVSASRPAVTSISASATVGLPAVTIAGSAAAVAAGTASAKSTKPASASRPSVAARTAAGASTKPVTGSRPAVAAISASATVGLAHLASASRPAVAAIHAAATVGLLIPTIVQTVTGTSTSDYGLSSVPITITPGNGIVLFAGWDLHNSPTAGPVPALYPADSANNLWVHLGTSGAGGYGSRSCIWACPNAQAVEWISASLTAFANSLAYMIIEVENFPDFADLDAENDSFLNAGVPTIELISATGSGTWRAQTGVTTVNAQCWAAGGGGQGGNQPDVGGSGGGGGEFAQEAALAVTPGTSYAYSVGAAGGGGNAGGQSGSAGGNTNFHGDSVTVTAHAGGGGHNTGGGSGGSGSSNTVHHSGGGGGGQSSAFHGCGGGGSGGTGAAGQSVGSDVLAGALPVTGGGPGGPGGQSTSPFYGFRPDNPPGGGGGGGGANNKSQGSGGNGANGEILLTYSVTGPETLTLDATTTTADIGFTMLTAGASSATLTSGPSSPWTALGTVSAGGAIDGVTIFPYWASSVSASTLMDPSWTVTAAASISGVLAAVETFPTAPVQANENFPNVYVQIAEGFQPGDPTAVPPDWTDISARCMGKDGDSFISVTYGQEYELSTPEAGELVVGVNNLDGAFTPGAPSPFTIALGMPVRVLAFWEGSYYQIGYAYVERTPVEFPDLPQWGLSKLTCTDSIAVLTSATMPSALQGDILADGPYAYLTCNEQYLSYVNGLTPVSGNLASYTFSEAAGLIAANSARLNQRAGMYADSTGPVLGPSGTSPALVETGDALNLFGDQGTGMGTGSISGSVSYTQATAGPGVIYPDPAMPDPLNADGVTLELWFVYSIAETSGQGVTLLQAFGPASSYWPTATFTPTGTGPASFSARILSTSNEIQLGLNGTQVNVGVFVPSASPQQLVIVFPVSGGSTLQVYLNGVLLDSVTLSGGETTAWQAIGLGPVNYAWSASPLIQNYVAGHFALYPYALSAGRIATHYSTGAGGAAGSTVSQGAAQILSWGYLGLPRGGPAGFGPAGSQVPDGVTLGPFYSLEGSSAADGLNQAILSDGGMMYAAPSGTLIILPRWALFNIASSVVFGDATDGSQVPYEMGQAYDFDNTYLYNIISVTRNDGPTTSITATVKNLPSQLAYFTRSALQQSISTTSDLDAYTLSNWESGQYAQPQMRVRELNVDAAGKPGLAFPDILIATVSTVGTVDRNPLGGSPISGEYIVEKVSHAIGPTRWVTGYQLSPYVAQATVLTLDTAGFNVIGANTLA